MISLTLWRDYTPTKSGGWFNVPLSFSVLLNSLRSSDEEINQSSDPMRQDDDQNPDESLVLFRPFLCGAVDNYPYPKNG